ncbi:MAG TPA: hypothetical protein ENJ95_14385 [Bacteroidetes bacterium]|nr:hypothetical protein [Bacteroidota bacterium]
MASKYTIQENIASFKKFYTYLYEAGKITKEELKEIKDLIYCTTLGFVHRAQVLPFWGWGLAGANAQNLKWCSIKDEWIEEVESYWDDMEEY